MTLGRGGADAKAAAAPGYSTGAAAALSAAAGEEHGRKWENPTFSAVSGLLDHDHEVLLALSH